MRNNIEGVRIINLPANCDDRGVLTSVESYDDIPIEILRIFYMHHIKGERGGHAHIETDQVLIPVYGSFDVTIYDGESTLIFKLDDANKGLFIPRLLFVEICNFSKGAVCLVLANTHYDIRKSLRNRQEFLKYINNR